MSEVDYGIYEPSIGEVAYRGTAAGTREPRRVVFCRCGSIIDPIVETRCADCAKPCPGCAVRCPTCDQEGLD